MAIADFVVLHKRWGASRQHDNDSSVGCPNPTHLTPAATPEVCTFADAQPWRQLQSSIIFKLVAPRSNYRCFLYLKACSLIALGPVGVLPHNEEHEEDQL